MVFGDTQIITDTENYYSKQPIKKVVQFFSGLSANIEKLPKYEINSI